MGQSLSGPIVEELSPAIDVIEAVKALRDWPHFLLFESALKREPVGRYSFLTADPIQTWQCRTPQYGVDPLVSVAETWHRIQGPAIPDLPPFQGGIAGLLSYELGRVWERIPQTAIDEFQLPVMAVGLYDWVIAWDHRSQRCWLISHGWPESNSDAQLKRAQDRIGQVKAALFAPRRDGPSGLPTQDSAIPVSPQFPLHGSENVTSTFTREQYMQTVQRVIDYIHAGDLFQANLSQRLLAPAVCPPVELYERLRVVNPAPFAALMLWDDWSIVSASPERFLCVTEGEVETRPIKGTRQRKQGPEADLFTRDELRESDKDQAENVMIVDLLRNDLSKVCSPGTVRVPHLCSVETYETVQHLVSEVRGQLKSDSSVWDLFRATFPGGSISGAPKVRAMQIISELEPTVRGPYCGSLFYVGFDGQTDSNLLIRTFVQRHGWLQCHVGGGIVAQSNPLAEYEETLTKAAGMLRALDRS